MSAFDSFGRGLTLRVAAIQVASHVAGGIQTRLMLELWGQSGSIFELTGVQAASYALGRISLLPLGFGVRDATLVSLLIQLGVPAHVAVGTAALDRGLGLGIRLFIGGISMVAGDRRPAASR